MQSLAIALWIEDALRQRTGLAAEDAVGLEHVPVAEVGEGCRRIEQLDILADAAAAAPLTGAACVGNESELMDADRD